MKVLRISLLVVLGLVIIVVAAAAIFVAMFDANRYKPNLENFVLEQTGKVLSIDGNVDLTLFPSIGVKLGRTSLSEKDSKQTLVAIESSRVSVALMPLLSGQVLIDGISIDGLAANVTRDKGGVLNVADLLGAGKAKRQSGAEITRQANHQAVPQTESLQLDIGSIEITNASLIYNDLQNNTDLKISGLTIRTGQIASQSRGTLEISGLAQSKSLSVEATFDARSNYKLDLPTQKLDLKELSAKLSGNWQDIRSIDSTLSLDLAVDWPSANSSTATYTINHFTADLRANISGQIAEMRASTAQARINIATTIGAMVVEVEPTTLALAVNDSVRQIASELKLPAFVYANEQLNLKQLHINASVTDPLLGTTPLIVTANGNLSLDAKSQTVRTELSGKLDDSPLSANASVANFSQPAITFDLALDQLKLDRFGVTTGSDTNATAESTTYSTPSAAPIDLSGLKGHNIKGKLRVGQVSAKDLLMDQVTADISLTEGRLSVAPHNAKLFGGELAGSLTVDANTNTFTLKETATNIKLDSLLMALGQAPRVTGKGSLALDLVSNGQTVKALQQNLSGNANIDLRDGSVKGIDIGAIINNVRGMLGKAPIQQGTGSGQTTFTELTASATIAKGIATNRDLNVKAPLFRLEGAGTVNIPQSSLDYLANVAVVETSSGQGGKDLAALRGVTIPIKISGKFDSPQYSVDVASLATELAKSKLGEKAQQEINKVVPGLGDALKGLFGR